MKLLCEARIDAGLIRLAFNRSDRRVPRRRRRAMVSRTAATEPRKAGKIVPLRAEKRFAIGKFSQ
jgi:hypothetical protein